MSSHTNDPRQPSSARPYVAPQIAPQDLPIDYAGFIAVIFGVAGVMFRVCICSTSSPLFSLHNIRFNALTLFLILLFVKAVQTELLAGAHILCAIRSEHAECRKRSQTSYDGYDVSFFAFLCSNSCLPFLYEICLWI